MNDPGAMGRAFERVRGLDDFHPGERIWWIYLRNAAHEWLEANDDADLRAAVDQVKSFPENLPNERRRWLALREAVGKVLGQQLA